MVKVVCPCLEKKLTSPSDKFLSVNPDKRIILVNHEDYQKQAEEIAQKLESPGKEYTVVKCYDD